jgi:hypothetical protein
MPDVPLSNGVMHVTNTLFVPPSLGTVAGLVLLNPGGDLGKFGQALRKAALADDFMDPGKQFTSLPPPTPPLPPPALISTRPHRPNSKKSCGTT